MKPRIVKIDGKWVCGITKSDRMQGATPQVAYGGWKARFGRRLSDDRVAKLVSVLDNQKQASRRVRDAIAWYLGGK